ncbi:MAG: tetratricopeptide repeat protein [Patescibacteria group bacterium]
MNDTPIVPSASHPRRVTFDMLAIWALSLTAAVAVLAFIPSATIPFIYSKVSLIAIGGLISLVLYILARLTRGNIIVPPVALVGAFWLVPLAYALSTLFSGAGMRSALLGTELESDTFGFMLILAVFATIVALAFRRSAQYRLFFKIGGIVLAIALALQVLFIIIGHVTSTFAVTTNVVGSFADMGMLVGLGVTLSLLALRFLTVSNRNRKFLWALIVAGLVALALVNSGLIWGLVGLTALGLFIEAIMRRRVGSVDEDFDGVATSISTESEARNDGETQGLGAPLAVLVIALFFIIGGSTIGASLVNAFGANYLDVRPSWQSTFDVGSHTYASSPLFGSGPGTFGTQWLAFRDQSLNNTVFWNVDFTSGVGFIPTSFVTTGIAGALAWIAFLVLFLYIGIRALLFRAPEEPFVRYVSIATFVGSIYVFTLAFFTIPGPVVLLTGFVFAGLFVSSLRYGGSRREWGIVFSKNPRVGFVIVFGLTLLLLASVLSAYVVIERYLGSVAYAEAAQALQAGNIAKAETDIQRSILFAPSDRAYQLLATASVMQMNAIANNSTLSPSEAQQQFQAALSNGISAATLATQIAPRNYQNWVVLGNVYQSVVPFKIAGAYDNAKAAFTQAVKLNPTNPTLPFALAQLEIAQGNAAAAETDLATAIGLKRDYTQAILVLSQLQVSEGKAAEALQAAEAAMYFAPNDANVLFQVGILKLGTGDAAGAVQVLTAAVNQNAQYANARFFLAVALATTGKNPEALAQLEAIAALSPENAQAVAADIASLKAGKNPFTAIRQGALGIPQTPVKDAPKAGTAPVPAQ